MSFAVMISICMIKCVERVENTAYYFVLWAHKMNKQWWQMKEIT